MNVLVTGATGLVGRATCEALVDEGASVWVASRNRAHAEALIEERRWTSAIPLELDLKDSASVARAVATAVATRPPDALVHAASNRTGLQTPFDVIDRSNWRDLFEVDIIGGFELARQIGTAWIERGTRGRIVLLSSIYGLGGVDQAMYPEGMPPAPVTYATAKAAVIGTTRYLATLWGRHGIRTNAVAPGGIAARQDPAFVEAYGHRVPVGRMASDREIAAAIVFLASERSSYINGQVLAVDGGWTAW